MPIASPPPITKYPLPPLILHPFADNRSPGKLVESSRANLMLQGLLPCGEQTAEDLERTLLEGRYCEIRMLFYVGRDLARWIEQCMEIVERAEELRDLGIRSQSFAALLIEDPPKEVRDKLHKWGVSDYRAIFSRALGLNAVFADAPTRKDLADDFIRNYYRFADQMFACRQQMQPFAEIRSSSFGFELYASGEYSRMLEREWGSELPSVDEPD